MEYFEPLSDNPGIGSNVRTREIMTAEEVRDLLTLLHTGKRTQVSSYRSHSPIVHHCIKYDDTYTPPQGFRHQLVSNIQFKLMQNGMSFRTAQHIIMRVLKLWSQMVNDLIDADYTEFFPRGFIPLVYQLKDSTLKKKILKWVKEHPAYNGKTTNTIYHDGYQDTNLITQFFESKGFLIICLTILRIGIYQRRSSVKCSSERLITHKFN